MKAAGIPTGDSPASPTSAFYSAQLVLIISERIMIALSQEREATCVARTGRARLRTAGLARGEGAAGGLGRARKMPVGWP